MFFVFLANHDIPTQQKLYLFFYEKERFRDVNDVLNRNINDVVDIIITVNWQKADDVAV